MNDTIVQNETILTLKHYANNVLKLQLKIKKYNSLYFDQGFYFTENQLKKINKLKKLKKKYQKSINKIIIKL